MRQVLINILGNAVKFTESGKVTLRVTERPTDEATPLHRSADSAEEPEDVIRRGRYLFEVADTGPGVPVDKQASIFEPFTQDEAGRRAGGTGLGLAISGRHVELMGGRIELGSAEGQGSRFFFTLDLEFGDGKAAAEERDWSSIDHLPDGVDIDALVVDDRHENLDVLAKLLERVGVRVRLAESGEEALERIRARMPDIVFADIRMPGMDGTELLRRIQDAYGEDAPHLVAATASVFEHQRREYFELGFRAIIDKPVQAADIYRTLAQLFDFEFENAPRVESEEMTELDLSTIHIPQVLKERMLQALSAYSVTELRPYVEELASIDDPAVSALSERIRSLLQQFDLDGVSDLLSRLPEPSA